MIKIEYLTATAHIVSPRPLPEFSYKNLSQVPKHGIISIIPDGDNSCPSALGSYYYNVEFLCNDIRSGQLEQALETIHLKKKKS